MQTPAQFASFVAEDQGVETAHDLKGGAAHDEIAFEIRRSEAEVIAQVVVWWSGSCWLAG